MLKSFEKRLEHITTPMTLSVIGCVVNGPGEARETNIGLNRRKKWSSNIFKWRKTSRTKRRRYD